MSRRGAGGGALRVRVRCVGRMVGRRRRLVARAETRLWDLFNASSTFGTGRERAMVFVPASVWRHRLRVEPEVSETVCLFV